MGFFNHVFYPLISSQAIALYTPQHPRPPVVFNPQSMYEIAQLTGCNGLFAVPSAVDVCDSH